MWKTERYNGTSPQWDKVYTEFKKTHSITSKDKLVWYRQTHRQYSEGPTT
jgi:hypothetical protein